MVRLTINLNGELAPEDAEAVARFNGKVDSLEQHQRALEQEHQALSLREDLPAREMDSEGTRVLFALHDCRREQLDLMPERMEILQALRGSVAAMVEDARNQRQKTVERIERAISKAGHRPETSPVYAVNPAAWEARFQAMVRESSDVAEVERNLADAITEERRFVQQIRQTEVMLAECREQLHRLNHKLLRI